MRHYRVIGTALASVAMLVASAAFTTTANAAATVISGQFTESPPPFDDPDTCAAQGFTFRVEFTDTAKFSLTVDAAGRFVRGFIHHDVEITFTNNTSGTVLYESDHFNSMFRPDGTEAVVGLAQRNYGVGGATLVLDVGRVVLDANGNPVFAAGQHPRLLAGDAVICPALA